MIMVLKLFALFLEVFLKLTVRFTFFDVRFYMLQDKHRFVSSQAQSDTESPKVPLLCPAPLQPQPQAIVNLLSLPIVCLFQDIM